MKYVSEREVAFDSDCIGFPSLGNCHGVIYVNTAGMFGYHASGSPLDEKNVARAGMFGTFVRGHAQGRADGVAL